MDSRSVYNKFNEQNKDGILSCTQKEFDEYMMYGLVLSSGKNYITRIGKKIKVDLIPVKELKFNIQLQNLIQLCEEKSKEIKYKRIYCMSERCYNDYKQRGLIITQDNKEYYRYFDKELWYVYIIN